MSENPIHPRASWDEYFMRIAQVVSSRSTCHRKYVGAVIVRNRIILSTGYNGSIRGMPHCTEVGHMMDAGHCVATIHAEVNAIIQAARNGVMIENADLYVTASPCWNCFKQAANAGIVRICYGEFYRDDRIFSVAEQLGIELMHLPVSQAVSQAVSETASHALPQAAQATPRTSEPPAVQVSDRPPCPDADGP